MKIIMRRVDIYANGVCLDMGVPNSSFSNSRKKGGGKRNRLSGKFSAASFRRLREFCVTHDVPGKCWGLTLTIPGNSLVWWEYVRDWVHLLSVWCNSHYVPMVWRCELQKRGQPHLHLVVYGLVQNCVGVMLHWQRLVSRSGRVLSFEKVSESENDLCWVNRMYVNGSNHAFDLQELTGDFRSWRYLVAHASKGKKSQEGWLGRQWGIVNRDSFKQLDGFGIDLEDRQMFQLRRWVRRLSRRRIGKYGKHFLLSNPNTIRRMIELLQDDFYLTPF